MVSEDKSNSKFSHIRASAVDLQHLRYAVAAADHGRFRRAADALSLQQSTISRCIRQIEHSIGTIAILWNELFSSIRQRTVTTIGRLFGKGGRGGSSGNRAEYRRRFDPHETESFKK